MTRKIGAQIIKRDLDLVISDLYIYDLQCMIGYCGVDWFM